MELLQDFYSLVLKPIYSLTSRIDERIKNIFITICCFALTASFPIYFTNAFNLKSERTKVHLACCVIIFVLAVFSIKKPLKRVKWNPLVFYTFFAAGLGIFIISLLHPIGDGYRAFSLILMFGFPCLYYVWDSRGDYETLYKRLAASTGAVAIIYFAIYAIIASRGELSFLNGRVCVTFGDPNMFSMIGMIAVNGAMYMLLVNKNSLAWFALTAVSLGIGTSIVYLGGSRLSILVVAASITSFVIFYIKAELIPHGFKPAGIKLVKLVTILVTIVLFVLAGNLLLRLNNMAAIDNAVQTEIEAATASEQETNDTQPDATQTEQEPVDDNNDVIDRIVDSTQETNADSFLSGRLTLWKNYSQFLNMTGNDFSKTDWDAMNAGTPKARHAHNNFFELAYRCGIPVACIHILLELIAGIICLIWLFGRKYTEPYYLFCICAMACYALESMFDIATLPFERPAPFFFYMAMIPIFMYKSGKKDENERYEMRH